MKAKFMLFPDYVEGRLCLFVMPEVIPEGYAEDDVREDFPGLQEILDKFPGKWDNEMENLFSHEEGTMTYREWVTAFVNEGWEFSFELYEMENWYEPEEKDRWVEYLNSIKPFIEENYDEFIRLTKV